MGALFFLFLMGLYLCFIIFVVVKIPRFKIVAIIFFIVLSFGDEIYGRYKLNKMCEVYDGIHIYETVKDVEGFETNVFFYDFWLTDYGYKYIENEQKTLKLANNGNIITKNNFIKKSQYLIYYEAKNIYSFEGFYSINGYYIINKLDKKILSDYIGVGYSGGWIQRLLKSIYSTKSTSVICNPNERSFDYNLWSKTIVQVLQPKP